MWGTEREVLKHHPNTARLRRDKILRCRRNNFSVNRNITKSGVGQSGDKKQGSRFTAT